MDVTIIGTGNMARGIGSRVVAGGHGLALLGVDGTKAAELAAELGGGATAGTVGDALAGDVVVLAVHYGALEDVLARYGDELDGKIVVDIVNPVDFATFEPAPPAAGSTAQEIAAARPNARVVKAFNTTFAGTLVAGKVAGEPLDSPIDAGPLRRARELEALGYLHIAIQEPLGTGFASTLKVAA